MSMERYISTNTCFDTKSYIQHGMYNRIIVTDEVTSLLFSEFIHGNYNGKPFSFKIFDLVV